MNNTKNITNIKNQTCPRRCSNRSLDLFKIKVNRAKALLLRAMFLLKNQNGIELKPSNAGFALVVTLLLMVSVSLIGLLALMNASTETLITRNEKEQKVAFQLIEAGLNEAYARVQLATIHTPQAAR